MSEEMIRAIIEKEGYPAPEEREEIMREMIEDLFVKSGSNQVARAQLFVANYGLVDTLAVMNSLQHSFSRPDSFAEDASLYRQYRLSYARLGDGRPFYNRREHETATNERGRAYCQT